MRVNPENTELFTHKSILDNNGERERESTVAGDGDGVSTTT